MTSERMRTDSILPRGAGLEHGRCKQSIFPHSIFGILVERLSFWRLHFCSDFVPVFFIAFVYAGPGVIQVITDFFYFRPAKKLYFVKADRVVQNSVFRGFLSISQLLEIKKSVTMHFALGYVEAVNQVSARLTNL